MQPHERSPASSGFSTSYQGTLLGMPSTHGGGWPVALTTLAQQSSLINLSTEAMACPIYTIWTNGQQSIDHPHRHGARVGQRGGFGWHRPVSGPDTAGL